jgi:hypothetical protein
MLIGFYFALPTSQQQKQKQQQQQQQQQQHATATITTMWAKSSSLCFKLQMFQSTFCFSWKQISFLVKNKGREFFLLESSSQLALF